MQITVVTKDEHDSEHGESVLVRGRYINENGAQFVPQPGHPGGGGSVAPPSDEGDLVVLQHLFTKTKLDNLLRQYSRIERNVTTQNQFCQSGAGNSADIQFPGWYESALKLSAEIDFLQKNLSELSIRLPKNVRMQHQIASRNEDRRQAAESLAKLAKLPHFGGSTQSNLNFF